ncbi:NADH dehydrogenase [ubiquinone] 1 alpha subcomplex assembly factor 4 [Xylocopa sonorina]|uniref:NADH dehydrogenase [ubiquinone] 1 alpha subcomplex assembly factor 4 n=1 Tax=Xylocopa sonorina TaxID=1818115 RepID=UPI00403B231B
MGKIYSLLTRPIRTFNVENRAARVISREKPVPAPLHSSTQRQKEMVDKLYPNFMEDQYKKDPKLLDHLKNVYVESHHPKDKPKEEITSSRSLPQNRSQLELNYYDHYGTPVVVSGKCSLKQAIQFISLHQQDPANYSVEKISEEYQLDKQLVENIVTNFKVFHSVHKEPVKLGQKKRNDIFLS